MTPLLGAARDSEAMARLTGEKSDLYPGLVLKQLAQLPTGKQAPPGLTPTPTPTQTLTLSLTPTLNPHPNPTATPHPQPEP